MDEARCSRSASMHEMMSILIQSSVLASVLPQRSAQHLQLNIKCSHQRQSAVLQGAEFRARCSATASSPSNQKLILHRRTAGDVLHAPQESGRVAVKRAASANAPSQNSVVLRRFSR